MIHHPGNQNNSALFLVSYKNNDRGFFGWGTRSP